MKLIIEIDEQHFELLRMAVMNGMGDNAQKIIAQGTPIPDNVTNGDVIKTMFDIKEVDMSNTYCVHFPEEEDYSHYFFKEWWDEPYQKGGK